MSIKKTNWTSNFTLIGKARINDNSFKIDETSESGFCYSNMNLGVDCGEKYGIVYANMMGGYATNRDNVLYVHGKKDDGKDDWENRFTINWDDRFDDAILDEVGDSCFINIGIETTENDKIYVQRFLSAYDAIKYVSENLTADTVINVKGMLKYNFYKENVSLQRNITSIFLSKAEPENYKATFTQSVLIDKDSLNPKEDVDVENGVAKVHVRILDYAKELNGIEYKGQYPYTFTFDYDFTDKKVFKLFYDKFFNVKKDIRQINFEGAFINSGATITATMDDVPDDVKQLIEMGLYTEEEILTKYAGQGNTERRYVLVRPIIRIEGDDENKVAVPQVFDERYTEADLEIQIENSNSNSDFDSIDTSALIDDSNDDLDWLSEL